MENATNVNIYIYIYASFFVSSLCNLLHPPLNPCLIFASPSLHLRSTLTPSWPDHGITLATSHLTPPLASALFPSTPYHLPSFRPFHLIFSFCLLCKWRGGKARSCGEAARQSVEKERRSTAREVSMGRALADTEKQ